MPKISHEIRDPIHVFIRLDSVERRILDSGPFQRLRCIHQLGLTYLVYPGATHKRFEHSLGVMELATRVFDVVTHPENLTDRVRDLFPQTISEDERRYWRRVLRMAALCHDIGHLPFSHAAEKELLPDGWDHERLTREIILSDEMQKIWKSVRPPLAAGDVVKLALGPKKASDLHFTDWETILSEIICGDAFGVDRMDYLLRDSHHTGVAYGKFDHYRLIDTLRILPPPPSGVDKDQSNEPSLGVEGGGLQSAEALLLARYFMFSQVYCHPVRRIYDIHLKDFLIEWLPGGLFPTDFEKHLLITDAEVISALHQANFDPSNAGHENANRIIKRNHFKLFWEQNPSDRKLNPDAGLLLRKAAEKEFDKENVRFDSVSQEGGGMDFPVLSRDGTIVSSLSLSQVLQKLPTLEMEFLFSHPDRDIRNKAENWLEENKIDIITSKAEE